MSSENESKVASHLGPTPVFRPLESVDLSRTVAAFPGLFVVGELDDVLKQPLEVTMTDDWMGYFNGHVMMELEKYYPGRLTHWRFLPDPALSQAILIKPQSEKEYGVQEVGYLETESATRCNLRLAMQALGVKRHPDRVWSFPLVIRTGGDGKDYIALTLKGATTRPVQSRKKNATAAGTTAPNGNTSPTGDKGATAPTATAPTTGTVTTAPDAPAPTKAPDAPAVTAGVETASAVQPTADTKGSTAPAAGQEKPTRTKSK